MRREPLLRRRQTLFLFIVNSASFSFFLARSLDSDAAMATALASSTSSSSRCAVSSRSRQHQRAGRRAPMAPRAGPSVVGFPFACFLLLAFSRSLASEMLHFPQSPCSCRRCNIVSLDRGRDKVEHWYLVLERTPRLRGNRKIALSRKALSTSFFPFLSQPRPLSFSLSSPSQTQRTQRLPSSSSSAPPPPETPRRPRASTAAPSAARSPRRAATCATRRTTPSPWRSWRSTAWATRARGSWRRCGSRRTGTRGSRGT